METERAQALAEFVGWAGTHLSGDEKGEAHSFLDRMFRAFGHAGVQEAGATFEARIPKAEGRGKKFADLLWEGRVLIEMKKRGEDLRKHFRQALDYWTWITPKPPYVILCNFDEFWVYDFINQMDSPIDTVRLPDLPERWGPLAFLFPEPEKPTFGNDHIAVTRAAADHLVKCFNKLVDPKRAFGPVPREKAQRFMLQTLVALFAEDIGLLPKYLVAQLLEDCTSRQASFDLLGGLFTEMNTKGRTEGGRFSGVEFFNGGLFAEPARIELNLDEVDHLRTASKDDWSKVRPEIFGTLFEHSMDQEERHAFGAHFTTPADIMKIVRPTIVEPWREQIEGAKNLKQLADLRYRISTYTVLDPACGSGNFLYIAYRELKRLEARLYERIAELSGKADPTQRMLGLVTAQQFYGLDINPFAVELAKVTMMIARKLAIDELHITEDALPLDNLDANFKAMDALIDPNGLPAVWPQTDVIIGNPPFLGAKRLKPERGPDYVNAVRKAYPDVPGMAYYCVYWIRKAHDTLKPCTPDDPLTGRAGLVGTQNIRNNQSRVGGLDHVVKDGTIIEAVENQPWSGEANVHVSIANWVKSRAPLLLPPERQIWSQVSMSQRLPNKKFGNSKANSSSIDYGLNPRACDHINSSLSDQIDVAIAKILKCNVDPQRSFSGQVPGHEGFVLTPTEARDLLAARKENRKVIWPFLIGRDMLTGTGHPTKFVIDFQDIDVLSASAYVEPFTHVREHVLPTREQKAEQGKTSSGQQRSHHKQFLKYWWRHSFDRPEMIRLLSRMRRYIACSDTTKRPVFIFVSPSIRPDHKLRVFAFDDDYSFGILQSGAHWLWFVTKCSKLKSDYNYTSSSVYDPFPWPQSPTPAQVDAVAEAGREVRRVREEALKSITGGLRAVYRTLELPGKNPLKEAHARLDRAVLDAYGFDPKGDLLAQLLALNLEVARREQDGEPVTAPGVPPGYPEPDRLVTDDCIRAS
ncbi:DNA methyltransferase [Tautonia marina]|uniref:DNA methyltransferase n=1 Tax=Tautonia marina TaxID=2653855 RepID=UPI001260A760|nr:DNA methyltransferase [Tautonia marina]